MKDKPLFSVVVPVYRVEEYLEKCVRSVLNQTGADLEIILVDDGSPDGCPAMCDAYALEDPRVRVIHKKNGGLSDARNVGVDAARGEYIIFLDSDDYISADTCQRLRPFTERDCDIIVGDGVAEGGNARLAHRIHAPDRVFGGKEYLKAAFRTGAMPMAAWLYVYKREFLEKNGLRFQYGILHEDDHFTPRAFLAAGRVVDSGVCFYHYVIREGSITNRKDLRKNAADLYATCLEHLEIYKTLEDPELKKILTDSLVVRYLSLSQQGRLYQYGSRFVRRRFVWSNAKLAKTKLKALLYCASPRIYWHINQAAKRR